MKTREYNYNGIAKFNYRIVSFGYTEMIIISTSLAGYTPMVYKLDGNSIKEAMQKYYEYCIDSTISYKILSITKEN